jgi:hypothetical protein
MSFHIIIAKFKPSPVLFSLHLYVQQGVKKTSSKADAPEQQKPK